MQRSMMCPRAVSRYAASEIALASSSDIRLALASPSYAGVDVDCLRHHASAPRVARSAGLDLDQAIAAGASGDQSAALTLRRSGSVLVTDRVIDRATGALGSRMNHTWYVTFEVPRSGTLVQRRNPRLSKTFDTEAEARDFARTKFDAGLIVTAGTINPHLPRRAIPSEEIPVWLQSDQAQEPADKEDARESTAKKD